MVQIPTQNQGTSAPIYDSLSHLVDVDSSRVNDHEFLEKDYMIKNIYGDANLRTVFEVAPVEDLQIVKHLLGEINLLNEKIEYLQEALDNIHLHTTGETIEEKQEKDEEKAKEEEIEATYHVGESEEVVE